MLSEAKYLAWRGGKTLRFAQGDRRGGCRKCHGPVADTPGLGRLIYRRESR